MGCFRNICHWRLKSKTPLKISSLAARKVVNIKNEKTVATNLLLVEFSSPSKLLSMQWLQKKFHTSLHRRLILPGNMRLEYTCDDITWVNSCQGVNWLNSCWKRVFLVRNAKVTWVTVSLTSQPRTPLKVGKNLYLHYKSFQFVLTNWAYPSSMAYILQTICQLIELGLLASLPLSLLPDSPQIWDF